VRIKVGLCKSFLYLVYKLLPTYFTSKLTRTFYQGLCFLRNNLQEYSFGDIYKRLTHLCDVYYIFYILFLLLPTWCRFALHNSNPSKWNTCNKELMFLRCESSNFWSSFFLGILLNLVSHRRISRFLQINSVSVNPDNDLSKW
jgi:hypothetical protein